MEHDVTPFWAEIKKYEDALAKDPASYCFVQLAELYRKSGLLDDAVLVAKKGCETHPDYVGGFMVLGRAYFDKGLSAESRTALEKVIGLTPDNLLARRLLAQIYAGAGETAAAEESLRFILSQNPADPECQALLDSLRSAERPDKSVQVETRSENPDAGVTNAPDDLLFEIYADDEEIIEDAELLEELTDEVVPEDTGVVAFQPVQAALDSPSVEVNEDVDEVTADESDPLVTATMAELYASQGFLKRALTIYRGLLETDPDNAEWNNRLYDLKMAIDEDTEIARHVVSSGISEEDVSLVSKEIPPDVAPFAGKDAPASLAGSVLDTLETWLDTIRRRR